MDNKSVLIIVLLIILVILTIVLVSKKCPKEKFSGGGGHSGVGRGSNASYQHSYSGVNANNYTSEYFNDCGNPISFSSPRKKLDNYGNQYNEYTNNGYWSWQNKEDRVLGCINSFMVNNGTTPEIYNEAVNLCKDV